VTQPLNVRAALKEIIDLSGLILDLSFASVIYDNAELAREVLELERHVDDLTNAVTVHMSLAIRDKDDASNSLPIFKAANVADRISDASAEIAKISLRGLGLDPPLRESLMESDEIVGLFTISEESKLAGSTLENSRMFAGVGFDIIAVKRDFQWMIDPEDDFEFAVGDLAVARGTADAVKVVTSIGGETP
jgi:uncharacterized protein with PhoU and TrkA domain